MRGHRPLQLTLAILKPDLMSHPARLKFVKEKIVDENFWIIKWKILQWRREEAEQFYQEHQERFFYKRLTSFMSRAKQTHPDSIRGLYGLTDTRNVTHGSDSVETAEKEIKHFFPEFDQGCWFRREAGRFQTGRVMLDDSQGIHTVTEDR